jgi:site-specific recombinase XerD
MPPQIPLYTWEEALEEYVLSLKSENTVRSDRGRVEQLAKWAAQNGATLHDFGIRHMNRCIGERSARGLSHNTLKQDGVCAMKFSKWCKRNGILDNWLKLRARFMQGVPAE